MLSAARCSDSASMILLHFGVLFLPAFDFSGLRLADSGIAYLLVPLTKNEGSAARVDCDS